MKWEWLSYTINLQSTREIEVNYIPDWIAKKIAERPHENPDELPAPDDMGSNDNSLDDDEDVPF